MTHETLSEAMIDDFERDGCVLVKGLFTPWVEGARAAIEENKASPSWRERTYRPEDGSAPFFQDYCVWDQFAGYRDIVRASPMAACAAHLMRSRTARIFHDHVLVKEPGNSVVTPWHQDAPYYLVEAQKTVSFWMPLDAIPKERSIEYIAGSHQWGKSFRPQRFDGTNLYADDHSDTVPDVEERRDQYDLRSWDVEPGDAIAFDFKTLHGASANHSSVRRRVISFRWVGDDARFVERPGKTSPAFPDLDYTHGEIFDRPQFPVIFNRETATGR